MNASWISRVKSGHSVVSGVVLLVLMERNVVDRPANAKVSPRMTHQSHLCHCHRNGNAYIQS